MAYITQNMKHLLILVIVAAAIVGLAVNSGVARDSVTLLGPGMHAIPSPAAEPASERGPLPLFGAR